MGRSRRRSAQRSFPRFDFGLIWLDYLRFREKSRPVQGLALFLPLGSEHATGQRLRFLNQQIAQFALFAYDAHMIEESLDLADIGNLDTHLDPPPKSESVSTNPEALLESAIRRKISNLDARLLPAPVYGQVVSLAGLERGIVDLLAVDRWGRLAVLELKASEDPHLPLQSLDYWMRVAHHAQTGEFSGAGYFPSIALQHRPPRMLLVAPAIRFHPTTERLLAFFSPTIEVERIGLGVEWQKSVHVVFRANGARRPEWA